MSQGGEQPQLRRRSRTTGMNALPFPYGQGKGMAASQNNMQPDEEDFLDEPRRQNTNGVRYDTMQNFQRVPNPYPTTSPIAARRQNTTRNFPRQQLRNTSMQYQTVPARKAKTTQNVHWLLPLGVGMVAMLVLWVFGSLLVAWGTQVHDDITYGMPRTYQTNAVVGHGGDSTAHPSHFIAINYNRQVVVTEWMAGDPAKSVNYVVPYSITGDNSNLTPVTVEFRDVTGHHKPDMIIHIHLHTQDQTFVFINDGTRFRPATSNDKIQV